MGLVTAGDVLNRWNGTSGKPLPSTVTPERLEHHIDTASARVLAAAGRTAPPRAGSQARSGLDGLCIDLAINLLQSDFYRDDPNMLEVLGRERERLLREAKNFGGEQTGGAFMDIVGAGG